MSVSGRYPFIPLLGISVREVSASPLLLPPRRIPPAYSLFVATYRYTVAKHKLCAFGGCAFLPNLKYVFDTGVDLAVGVVPQKGVHNALVKGQLTPIAGVG